MVPIRLEALVALDPTASVFSVGALHEKGVKLDLLPSPPVLHDDDAGAFPLSTGVPSRMFVLHVLLDGREEPHHIFPQSGGHGHVAPMDWSLPPSRFENASREAYTRKEC